MTAGGRIIITQGDQPTTPPSSGKSAIYAKTDNNLYIMHSNGEEFLVTTISGTAAIDHGNLIGLSDDDHIQYLNVSRGDIRYYTKTQLDTISGSIVSQIPTDYYTTLEIDNTLSTVSGILQSQITANTDLIYSLDSIYTTDIELSSVSGTLQTEIDGKADIGHNHNSDYDIFGTASNYINIHESTYNHNNFITLSSITYENLSSNGDVGTNSTQVAQGDHTHDDRYYTESEIETWRASHPFTASGITYINDSWPIYNVAESLDSILSWNYVTGFSGRFSPELPLTISGTTDVFVEAGTGYISSGGVMQLISWEDTLISGAGYFSQHSWYVYSDINGDISYTTIFPASYDIIRIGTFLPSSIGPVLSVIQDPVYINNANNRVANTLHYLGPFIPDGTGTVQVSNNNNLALTFTQANVYQGTVNTVLPQVDTVTDISKTMPIFRGSVEQYLPVYWQLNFYGGNGKIFSDRWNDISKDLYNIVTSSFSFTQGSQYVTVSGISEEDVTDNSFICLASDGVQYMTPITISGVNTVGYDTTITLDGVYTGTTASGSAIVIHSLPRVNSGKYVKHLLGRLSDQDGTVYIMYGQTQFDSEYDAIIGNLPTYPDYIKKYDIAIAYLLGSNDTTSWEGNIYDLRPVPFYRDGGNGSSGGGGTAVSHSSLSDLDSDDHLQYLRTDGNRNLIGIQKYNAHPNFINNTDIIDKKYVDDSIAGFSTDHGDLTGLSDDDHTQYLLINGSRNLTGKLSYQTHPTLTLDTDVVDKKYVDDSITVFGTYYSSNSDESQTSTNSTDYIQKLRLSVSDISTGYYRIGWFYEWRRSSITDNFSCRVQIDDSTTIMEQWEASQGSYSWHTDCGYYITELTSGSHYFDLDYCGQSPSYTSYIRRVRFEFWRVS